MFNALEFSDQPRTRISERVWRRERGEAYQEIKHNSLYQHLRIIEDQDGYQLTLRGVKRARVDELSSVISHYRLILACPIIVSAPDLVELQAACAETTTFDDLGISLASLRLPRLKRAHPKGSL